MPIIPSDEYKRSTSSNVVISESGHLEPKEEWDYEKIPDNLYDSDIDTSKSLIPIAPSQFVEFSIRVPDKITQTRVPFSFDQRRYLKLPYDTPSKRVLLKTARQVEKSTLLGNKALAYCCINPSFNVLYVSPSNQQTKTFSQDRLKEPMETSNVLKAWTTAKLSDSVYTKKFINRSQITLRYAYHNADRVRGIPADCIDIDEIQDINTDNIPVIEECASHSPHKIFIYSGTPKSYDNPIEKYWSDYSTQNEWVIPCDCTGGESGRYWNVLGEENIGKQSLICARCGKKIEPMHPDARWAMMNGSILKSERVKEPFEGYRIPQLMVPWVEWTNILHKYNTVSRAMFFNEVLGMSFDSGTRPLTRQDVIDNCRPEIVMTQECLNRVKSLVGAASPVYMGVDWGGGCHDEETRILTSDGFINFRDLTTEHLVAQFDKDTRAMSYVLPSKVTSRDFSGTLVEAKNQSVDLLITDNHRVLFRGSDKCKWQVDEANSLKGRSKSVLVGHVKWEGPEVGTVTLPGVPGGPGFTAIGPASFMMDDWLEFLGYYLAEGGVCHASSGRPSCLKMSQRDTVNHHKVVKMRSCMDRLGLPYSEFPNQKTGDVNWTMYGKQFWSWVINNVGEFPETKRIPRQFMSMSRRQLQILLDAMMSGDGSVDKRSGTNSGKYRSTSKGLCEDVQEIFLKLGMRASVAVDRKASGNRKTLYRTDFSPGRDLYLEKGDVSEREYTGKVYCCTVPSGFIVTERNGKISFQGNSENSYTLVSLGAYLNDRFQIFYMHRFEGAETEPTEQLDLIEKLIRYWNVSLVGCDYGGGFFQNDHLRRRFGKEKIVTYQYSQPKQKVRWDSDLFRYLVHRTEVMSDVFSAIKRRDVIAFPNWEHFQEPFGNDMLNIFSEYNEQQRQLQYKKSPDCTDDSFHSILLCFLVSMIRQPRFDVLNPSQKTTFHTDD